MNDQREELIRLANRQVDEQLSKTDQERLVQLLSSDARLVDLYTNILCLHGQLTWDAGQGVGLQPEPASTTDSRPSSTKSNSNRRRAISAASAAALLLVIVGGYVFLKGPPIAGNGVAVVPAPDRPKGDGPSDTSLASPEGVPVVDIGDEGTLKPLDLSPPKRPGDDVVVTNESKTEEPVVAFNLPKGFTDDVVITQIDAFIEKAWADNEITPTAAATDAEWVRRTYLTFAGRIPSVDESASFLSSDSPRKRNALVDQLLSAPERNEHLATIWTNLLVGRTERRGVNRDKLFEFLTTSFEENSPWIDMVGELITASGRNDENGATNFLLAHLNDQATPATAVTARLFMGEQISCVQCHDHPFSKGVRQEDYWALNAFFKDTVRVEVADANAGAPQSSKYLTCRLIDRPKAERITHFETRSGQQRAVLPRYSGEVIPESSQENRRERLAQLLASDGDMKIAKSMVNRMWAHFFGYGFTNPVDDMGPHAAVSHPEVLSLLTEAFVKSEYDLNRLMTWISSTRAWQLSSMASNVVDMPEHGELPLFSRVYTRRMTPEQVYESIRVAIRSASGQRLDRDENSLEHRRAWVQQFAHAYNTDENDESLEFDGTIVQALLMMNGTETDMAIQQATQAIINNMSPRSNESDALDRVALAMLTREPTAVEKRAFRARYHQLGQQISSRKALPVAVEDMMWAYLNSSEFVLVH